MVEAYGISDPGCVRKNNEDCYLIEPDLGLYLVADGMGGANAGGIASRLAVKTVLELVKTAHARDGALLDRAFQEANRRLRELAARDTSLAGMGTTLVGVLETGTEFAVASVGDSRCYVLSGDRLKAVTVDQTWVEEVGRPLGIDEEKLKNHPMRHVLTMAVGASASLKVRHYLLPLDPGQQILLCSDGLHGVVPEEFIAETLRSPRTLEQKCHYLVEAAKAAGGPDNITVVLLQTPGEARRKDEITTKRLEFDASDSGEAIAGPSGMLGPVGDRDTRVG